MKEVAPIKIAELERMSRQHGLQAMVVLTVERDGTVSVVSYGENPEKCKAIGDWAKGLWKYAVSIIPFQTVFGWGNNGIPKPLDPNKPIYLGIDLAKEEE